MSSPDRRYRLRGRPPEVRPAPDVPRPGAPKSAWVMDFTSHLEPAHATSEYGSRDYQRRINEGLQEYVRRVAPDFELVPWAELFRLQRRDRELTMLGEIAVHQAAGRGTPRLHCLEGPCTSHSQG